MAIRYFNEADKRSRFTYETGEEAKHNHARTSLQRAKEFLNEVEKIVNG